MISVIKIDRKKLLLAALVLLGLALCAAGFSGAAQRMLGLQNKSNTAAKVTINESDNQEGALEGANTGNNVSPELAAVPELDNLDSSAFFVEYRMERERAVGKEVEMLREVLASASTDDETRKTANERLLLISSNISQEMELENLIRAQGFEDVAVFLDSNIVTVVVQPGRQVAAEADSTEIVKLVSKTTGIAEDGVIVITKEQ